MFAPHFRILIRLMLAVYWLALFIGTHIPTVPAGVARFSDKLLHYLAFGGLAFLLAMDQYARRGLTWRRAGQIWLLVAAYAAVDEILQIPVGRTADVRDWFADVTGAACALGAAMLLTRIIGRPAAVPKEEHS